MMDLIKKYIKRGIVFPQIQDHGTNVSPVKKITQTAYTITLAEQVKNQRKAKRIIASLIRYQSTTKNVTFQDIQLLKEIYHGSRECIELLDELFKKITIHSLKGIKTGSFYRRKLTKK